MFKNQFKLFCFFLALIMFSQNTIPMHIHHYHHQQIDPKDELRKSPILEAKLLLNVDKALAQSILKRRTLWFEVMLEKIQQFKNLYGELTPAQKNNLLQLIKKERGLEKKKLKTFSSQDKISLAIKGIGTLADLALESYLFSHLFKQEPATDAFSAICQHLEIMILVFNMPVIMGLGVWTILDYFKTGTRLNIGALKSMKKTIKGIAK